MSFMKWFIISSIITMPLLFILPGDNPSNYTGDNNQYAQILTAQLHFDEICSNAILQNCSMDVVKSAYTYCTVAYGNLTFEQCAAKCCDPKRAEQESSFFGIKAP